MRTLNKSNYDDLAKEFKDLEEKNKAKKIQHNNDFDKLKQDSRVHQKRVNDRLNKFIPSRNK